MTPTFASTDQYYADQELTSIVNVALALEKPLLLTGEPGTGKTQLAFAIAKSLDYPLEVLRCKSTIKGEEACYTQDTVLRLNDSRFGSGQSGRRVEEFFDYIIWGPIGRAFRADRKVVLLLDEIDKTESDVQDNLLDVLEDCSFAIREINTVIKAVHRPVIIITSNAKRELSDPFLRRCFCHHLPFPSREALRTIIALHFPVIERQLVDLALNVFDELRGRGYAKAPATSELLEWLAALQMNNALPGSPDEVPYPGILLKRSEDLVRYQRRELPRGPRR